MTYNDLVQQVAKEFIEEISVDLPSCERFSEYVNNMQMTSSEVRDEFISLSDFVIREFKDNHFIYIDSYTGDVTCDEFDEEVPFRVFKRDVVKLINEALK